MAFFQFSTNNTTQRQPPQDIGKGGAWTVWPGDEYIQNQRIPWIKLHNYPVNNVLSTSAINNYRTRIELIASEMF